MDVRVVVPDVEIRGSEIKKSKKDDSEYIVLQCEDSRGKHFEIIDREADRFEFYKKGIQGDFHANLVSGKDWARLNVVDFKTKA